MSRLPWVNATINSVTAILLLCGVVSVKVGRVALHQRFMSSAFVTSTFFLLSYVTYHWFSEGPAIYHGGFRSLYLFILLTHIVLATLVLPLALTTLARGWFGAIPSHKRIAPATFAVWMYVSVTGILVYLIINNFNPA